MKIRRVSILIVFYQVERLRKENASLRWRLAMAGTKSNNNPTSDEAGVMLNVKESKIRILEEQVKGAAGAWEGYRSRLYGIATKSHVS